MKGMPLVAIGAAFFVGRTVSHAAWTHLGRLASAFVETESQFEGRYLSGYFVVTQIVLLGLVYILMKLDGKMRLECRRLVCRRAVKLPAEADRHHGPRH